MRMTHYGITLATITFCAHAIFAQPKNSIRIISGGPNSNSVLLKQKAELEKVAGVPIELSINPTDSAMKALVNRLADIMVSSSIPAALEIAEKNGLPKQNPNDFMSFDFASNIIKYAVHPDNPSQQLNREQMVGILSGKITSWESINGKKIPINVWMARNYMSTVKLVNQHYLDGKQSPVVKEVLNKDGLLKAMQKDPGSIAIFPRRQSSPDFAPKFFNTEVKHETDLIIRKDARPEVIKLFEYMKSRPQVTHD